MTKRHKNAVQNGLSGLDLRSILARCRLRTFEEGEAPEAGKAQRRPEAALPPAGNTGGNSGPDWIQPRFIIENGQCKEIPGRRGHGGEAAFVDWLNFTCHEDEFRGRLIGVSDDEVVTEVSYWMSQCLGFGITEKRPGGMNFYERSYTLGDGFGVVCHGGQRGTVLVSISGAGCAAAVPGWEKRLFDFLNDKPTARITRVDLAYDDFEGVRTVDDALEWHLAGQFTIRRTPTCQLCGDWLNPNGKGRSFYVGSRDNGKMLRAYEKGRQLGDPNSPWVRFEGELRNVDRIIPFDVLLQAGAYLAAMYPALAWVSEVQHRIACTKKTAEITYQAVLDWLHVQCGAALWVASQIEGGAEKLLDKIMRVGDFPKRLKVPDRADGGRALHERSSSLLPELESIAFA